MKKLSELLNIETNQGKTYSSKSNVSYLPNFKKSKQSHQELKEAFDFMHLIKSWHLIAGEKIAEHTIPLKNQNGTLIILSNHGAFASELSYREVLLKKKIFDHFPILEKSILKIKFIVDSTIFAQKLSQNILPISTKNISEGHKIHPHSPLFKKLKQEGEFIFKDIEDTTLREKFVSLFIQTHFE